MTTTQDIISACAQSWGVAEQDITGKGRTRQIADAKHYARYLMREELGMNLTDIAAVCGCTHANIINSISKVREWMYHPHYYPNEHYRAYYTNLILAGA